MNQAKRLLLQKAIGTWGNDAQIMKTVEELGELLSAIGRYRAHDPRATQESVAEEIADVRIMLHQLCMIWGLEDMSATCEYTKLARLRDRLLAAERSGA